LLYSCRAGQTNLEGVPHQLDSFNSTSSCTASLLHIPTVPETQPSQASTPLPQISSPYCSTPLTISSNPSSSQSSITSAETQQSSFQSYTPPPTHQLASRKKRKLDNERERQLNDIDFQINRLIKASDEEDDAYHLFLGWAGTYRKLSRYQQAVARKKINDSLFEAEFQTPKSPPA